jgi:hypothetical protein
MKLPFKSVVIAGKPWRVEASLDFEDDCYGSTKVGLCLIQYDSRLPAQRLRDIIWHEIKHAIMWENGVSYMISDPKHEIDEEVYIRCMTPVELDVLRANPLLAEWLIQED